MKIKELKESYPLVYQAALDNQEEQGNKANDELYLGEDKSCRNFNFDESSEGFSFWINIKEKRFDKAKEICPHLFETEPKYYPDLSQHIGRYIKALVDGPTGGSYVKAGDIGKIVSKSFIDFPNCKGYAATEALSLQWERKYELMPEDYNPEIKSVEYNLEVVHCTTQEELEFVKKSLNIPYPSWDYNKENTCIYLKSRTHGSIKDCDKKYKIHSFQEWCNKFGHKPDFKPQFEVGKWYKAFWTHINRWIYIKPKTVSETNIFCERYDAIWPFVQENHRSNVSNYCPHEIVNSELLTDLSEIQQYLPDGHVDKISSTKNETMNKLSESQKQVLLAEAKEKYPKGTIFKSIYNPAHCEVNENIYIFDFNGREIIISTGNAAIWAEGYGWAKIISTPETKDKIPNNEYITELDDSYIGKYLSLYWSGDFYDKVLVIKENGMIRLLNNSHPNNNEHKDKSIYKYSLMFSDWDGVLRSCKKIKLLPIQYEAKYEHGIVNTIEVSGKETNKLSVALNKDYFKDAYSLTPKESFKSLFDKDYHSPLNKALELPKKPKKQTKQLIY